MNGIVITSLDGGRLLYEQSYIENFGIGPSGVNALQLASSLFTLFRISQGDNNENGLNCIKKGNTCIYFSTFDNGDKELLFTIFLDSSISVTSAKVVCESIVKSFENQVNLFQEVPIKSVTKRAIRSILTTVQKSITTTLIGRIGIHPSIQELLIVQSSNVSFESWLNQQWNIMNNIQSNSNSNINTPSIITESNNTESTVISSKGNIATSNSEKLLPPIINKEKPIRSGSFSQLFRRFLPRFDNNNNRSNTPTSSGNINNNSGTNNSETVSIKEMSKEFKCIAFSRINSIEEGNGYKYPVQDILSSLKQNYSSSSFSDHSNNLEYYITIKCINGFWSCSPIECLDACGITPNYALTEWKLSVESPAITSDVPCLSSYVVIVYGNTILIAQIIADKSLQGMSSDRILLLDLMRWSKFLLKRE